MAHDLPRLRKKYMEKNSTHNIPDTTAPYKHTDMPVKTPGTDTKKNTAEEEGLNHDSTDTNEIKPGTTPPGDE